MNASSERRLAQVHPFLAAKIKSMADALAGEGIVIQVIQGLRTFDEQDALYAQGRTAPGNIVTNAKGGQSWHNFGCAVDLAPFNPDGSVDWNANHPQWKRMEAEGVKWGLTAGANWVRFVDAPHFQYTGGVFPENAPNDEARTLYAIGGLQAVWNELTRRLELNGDIQTP